MENDPENYWWSSTGRAKLYYYLGKKIAKANIPFDILDQITQVTPLKYEKVLLYKLEEDLKRLQKEIQDAKDKIRKMENGEIPDPPKPKEEPKPQFKPEPPKPPPEDLSPIWACLKGYGIVDKITWKKWMAKNHPDCVRKAGSTHDDLLKYNKKKEDQEKLCQLINEMCMKVNILVSNCSG